MECRLVWLDSMNQDHLDLRFRVLRIGMPRGTEHYPKVDNDSRTKFLCAYVNEKMVGCSTLQVDSRDGCKYRIRGMAVDSEYRNKGIGSKIVNELQRIAEEEKTGIWCNARIKAVPMYARSVSYTHLTLPTNREV